MTADQPTLDRPQRILVTGSRDWGDVDAVVSALDRHTDSGRIPTVIVHGDCPTGADKIADDWVAAQHDQPYSSPVAVEPHAADWSRGRRAGPERNADMVALGADLCLAFIGPCTSPRCSRVDLHPSHGASGCAALAETAGIPTERHTALRPSAQPIPLGERR